MYFDTNAPAAQKYAWHNWRTLVAFFSPSQHHDKLYQWVSICSCVWESICDQNSSESPYPVWEGKGRRLRKSVTVTALYICIFIFICEHLNYIDTIGYESLPSSLTAL